MNEGVENSRVLKGRNLRREDRKAQDVKDIKERERESKRDREGGIERESEGDFRLE